MGSFKKTASSPQISPSLMAAPSRSNPEAQASRIRAQRTVAASGITGLSCAPARTSASMCSISPVKSSPS